MASIGYRRSPRLQELAELTTKDTLKDHVDVAATTRKKKLKTNVFQRLNRGKRTRQATRLQTIYLDSMLDLVEELGQDFVRLFYPSVTFWHRMGFGTYPQIAYFKYKGREMTLFCQQHHYKEPPQEKWELIGGGIRWIEPSNEDASPGPYLENYNYAMGPTSLDGNIRYDKYVPQAFVYVVKADQDEEATKKHWTQLLECKAIRFAAVLIVVAHTKDALALLKPKDIVQWRRKIRRMLPHSTDDRMKAVKIIHVDILHDDLELKDEDGVRIDCDADDHGFTKPLPARLKPFREGFEWLASQYK